MTPFAANLRLVLKLLSMSSAGLAAQLRIDKSVVSRWLRGSGQPSAHNMSLLSTLVAERVSGFRTLDWELEPASLARLFDKDAQRDPDLVMPAEPGLALDVLTQLKSASAARGDAYEGFFKSTRPHPMDEGRFIFEHGLIRRDASGLLRMWMGSPETLVNGWLMPLGGLVYSIASDAKTGTMMFGIFNGVSASRVDVFDGLTLIPASDMGRSPTATGILCERIGVLSDDQAADDRRFAELRRLNPLAPEGAVPEHIARHLTRDIGPIQMALGGDWLLKMTLARSLSRGPDYDAASLGDVEPAAVTKMGSE